MASPGAPSPCELRPLPSKSRRLARFLQNPFAGIALLWTGFVVAGCACDVLLLERHGAGESASLLPASAWHAGYWAVGLAGLCLGFRSHARHARRAAATQVALAESERSFREFHEKSPVASYNLDHSGRLIACNEAFLDLFRLRRDEVAGRPLAECVAFLPTPSPNSPDAAACDAASTTEVITRDRTGAELALAIRTRVFRGNDGRILEYLCVAHDITALRQPARLQSAHTLRLQALVTNLTAAVLVEDPRRRVVFANPQFCQLFGLGTPPDSLVGAPSPSLSEQTAALFREPADFLGRTEAMVRNGKPSTLESLLLKDGRIFARDYQPLAAPDGSREHLWVYRDVTAYRRAEEALRVSEARLRESQAIARLGHFQLDFAHNTWTGSDALLTILGLETGGPRTFLSWMRRVHPDDRAALRHYFATEVQREQGHFNREFRIVRASDLAERWLHGIGRCEQDTDGRLRSMFGTLQDVTERRGASERLKQRDEQLTMAMDLAKIAHWEFDGTTNLFTFNDRFYTLCGTTAEAEGGYLLSPQVYAERFLPVEERELVAREVARTLAAGAGCPARAVEHRLRRRDGAVRHISVQIAVITGATGQPNGARGVTQDLTDRVAVEQALRDRQAELHGFYDSSPFLMGIIELAGGQLVAIRGNAAMARTLNVRPEDIPERTAQQLGLTRDVAAQWVDRCQACERLRETVRFQFATQGPNVPRHLAATVSFLGPSPQGRPRFSFVAEDVTEHRKIQLALAESEARTHAVLESTTDFIWSVDAHDFSLLTFNRAFRDYCQHERGIALRAGLTPSDLVPPDTAAWWLDAYRQTLRDGQYTTEYTTVAGAHTLHFSLSVLRNRDDVFGIAAFGRDITQRKRAERALQESEERLRHIIATTGAGYFRLDRRGHFSEVNTAWLEMHGYSSAREIIGQPFTATQVAADQRDAERIVQHVLRGEDVPAGEFSRQCRDGSVGYHSFTLHAVREGGVVVGAEGFLIDTTALRRARSGYKMLFDTMLDGFAVHEIICDGNGTPIDYRFLEVNPAFERMTGLKSADVVGRTAHEALPGLEQELVERYGQVALTGEPVLFEHYTAPLGRHFQISAFRPGPGQFACVFVDVTLRFTAEQQLRKLSRAVEQSPNVVMITDAAGTIEYINPSFTRVTGFTAEEARGRNPRILKSGRQPAEFYRELWTTITSGREWRGELHNRRKNGELFWESATISPIIDEHGHATHFLAVKEEVSERKRAEAQIREQAALLDITRDAIIVVQLDRTIASWNRGAEHTFGWPAAEVIGRNIELLWSADHITTLADIEQTVLAEGSWNGEVRQLSRTGAELVVQFRGTLMRDPAGEPCALLCVSTDITEAKKLEQQFYRAQRLDSLGSLASGVAHDLNNVLTPILMSVEVLQSLATDPRDQELFTLVADSARRGADVVRQLLLFGRGSESQRSSVSISVVIREVGGMMRETFPKQITVSVQAPSDLWSVHGDQTQLHQVLLNLCVNARDALPAGGRLKVTAENVHVDEYFAQSHLDAKPGPYVLLRVIDSGSGIPAELLDKIFDPFFTTKPTGKGTGLGLSTALGIVRSHGGFIDVSSQVGAGTEFSVYLPATFASSGDRRQASDRHLLLGQGELILLVDDEPGVRDVLARALLDRRYEVLTASDGAEALALFAAHRKRVRAVITDMMMPVMDGLQTIHALRRVSPGVPVIAISGVPAHRHDIERLGLPHVPFLLKPFTVDAILGLLRTVLNESSPSVSPDPSRPTP